MRMLTYIPLVMPTLIALLLCAARYLAAHPDKAYRLINVMPVLGRLVIAPIRRLGEQLDTNEKIARENEAPPSIMPPRHRAPALKESRDVPVLPVGDGRMPSITNIDGLDEWLGQQGIQQGVKGEPARRFAVNQTGRAHRCEVCHKSDLLDTDMGYCRRCDHITK